MADPELEEALEKSGTELFRELLRLFPVANVEDYIHGGVWKDDLMKMDLQLFLAFRREAGAAEPLPLDEVKLPDLPQLRVAARPVLVTTAAMLTAGLQAPKVASIASIAVRSAAAAGHIMSPTAKAVAKAPAVAGSAGAELKFIALFIAKFKLDPGRSKLLLARLTPAKRRFIMKTFESTLQGDEATTELEAFIKIYEDSGWVELDQTNGEAADAELATLGEEDPRKIARAVPKAGRADPGTNSSKAGATAKASPPTNGAIKRPLAAIGVPAAIHVDPASKRPAIHAPAAKRPRIAVPGAMSVPSVASKLGASIMKARAKATSLVLSKPSIQDLSALKARAKGYGVARPVALAVAGGSGTARLPGGGYGVARLPGGPPKVGLPAKVNGTARASIAMPGKRPLKGIVHGSTKPSIPMIKPRVPGPASG